MQEGDSVTCEPAPNCHRCTVCRGHFLSGDHYPAKSTLKRKSEITSVAGGAGIIYPVGKRQRTGPGPAQGRRPTGAAVVTWDADGSNVRPGPAAASYEPARKTCKAHLLFNAFWLIPFFCVHQMLMRDPKHQIDLGVILHHIKAILRKYKECVEDILGITGKAAAKLGSRLQNMLKRREGANGQR